MPRAGFELTIPASERPQTDAFDRVATGVGAKIIIVQQLFLKTENFSTAQALKVFENYQRCLPSSFEFSYSCATH